MNTELSDYAMKTYRYLRLAMVVLIMMLAAAVTDEWSSTDPHCFQTSISAYYYTPARAVFVGALLCIGVCMVVLKGNTEAEDVLLNVGGMLAPVVAFVPSSGKGGCRSATLVAGNPASDVANNMTALFGAGGLGLVLTFVFAYRSWHTQPTTVPHRGLIVRAGGLVVAAVILVGGVTWFHTDRAGFIGHAHYTAAIALFVCIIVIVVLNAWGLGAKGSNQRVPLAKRYLFIAVAMVASTVGMALWDKLHGWSHGVLWIEGTLIVLFAAFWVIQTAELWDDGVRQGPAAGGVAGGPVEDVGPEPADAHGRSLVEHR